MNPKRPMVVIIGPGREVMGGITAIINGHMQSELNRNYDLRHVASHVDGNWVKKLFQFLMGLGEFIFISFSEKFKIVHIHSASRASFFRKCIFLFLSKAFGKKTILHLHGAEFEMFFNDSNRFVKKLIVKTFDSADVVIVLSNVWKKFVETFTANPRIYILFNGCSSKKFSGRIQNNGKIVVLCMGKLGQRKGTYDLLKAFEKAVKIVPDLQLILGGDGEVDQAREIVSQKGLSNHVIIPGWIAGEEKIRMFKSCDFYVLPSYNEGLPGSVLEAMAVGVPVISTPVGGIPEAVIENRNGFLIRPGDVDSLCEQIVKLGQNRSLREKMGVESQKIIKEKFEVENIVDQLGEIYAEVLSK